MITEIHHHSHFKKMANKLPQQIKNKFLNLENIFLNNPFDPQLKTHKLHGKLKDHYSFSVTQDYRVIFEFINPQTVIFLKIGTHGIY